MRNSRAIVMAETGDGYLPSNLLVFGYPAGDDQPERPGKTAATALWSKAPVDRIHGNGKKEMINA